MDVGGEELARGGAREEAVARGEEVLERSRRRRGRRRERRVAPEQGRRAAVDGDALGAIVDLAVALGALHPRPEVRQVEGGPGAEHGRPAGGVEAEEPDAGARAVARSEEHTSELQS